jgi:hypothetical protein
VGSSLTYANSTGRTVSIEMAASLQTKAAGAVGGTAAPQQTAYIGWTKSGGGSQNKSGDIDSGTFVLNGATLTTTLANGDTITFSVFVGLRLNTPPGTWGAGTITWSDAHLRMTTVIA